MKRGMSYRPPTDMPDYELKLFPIQFDCCCWHYQAMLTGSIRVRPADPGYCVVQLAITSVDDSGAVGWLTLETRKAKHYYLKAKEYLDSLDGFQPTKEAFETFCNGIGFSVNCY